MEDQQKCRALVRKEDAAVGQRDRDNSSPIGGCSQDDDISEERGTVSEGSSRGHAPFMATARMQEEHG